MDSLVSVINVVLWRGWRHHCITEIANDNIYWSGKICCSFSIVKFPKHFHEPTVFNQSCPKDQCLSVINITVINIMNLLWHFTFISDGVVSCSVGLLASSCCSATLLAYFSDYKTNTGRITFSYCFNTRCTQISSSYCYGESFWIQDEWKML